MSKKDQIEKYLNLSFSPKEIAKKVGTSVHYVYHTKLKMTKSLKKEAERIEDQGWLPKDPTSIETVSQDRPIALDYGKAPKEISVTIDLQSNIVTMPFSEFQEFLKYWKVAA